MNNFMVVGHHKMKNYIKGWHGDSEILAEIQISHRIIILFVLLVIEW